MFCKKNIQWNINKHALNFKVCLLKLSISTKMVNMCMGHVCEKFKSTVYNLNYKYKEIWYD